MFEKIFERLLDCKEIKLVNPKENQSWIFIGRTDAEAETPIYWPPQFSSVQFSHSVVSDSLPLPWTTACQASLSITNSQRLLKLMSIELVMPSNHLILCRPLFLPSSIFHSIRVFSNESLLCIRWPKFWSFSFSISPSNEYSGLISFRTEWFDLQCTPAYWAVQDWCATPTMWIGPNWHSCQ